MMIAILLFSYFNIAIPFENSIIACQSDEQESFIADCNHRMLKNRMSTFETVYNAGDATGNSALNGSFIDHSNTNLPPEICDNGIDDDGDGLVDCNDPDCNPLTNPFPGFPIDFDNNNCSWIDYYLGSDLTLMDNGNGTMTISGTLDNAVDADWDACVSSPCGSNDEWLINLTLSDRKNWTDFQASGGSAFVHGNCSGQEVNLDYWHVTGTLTGTGCNTGRTLSITGPQSPYRLQIGNGGISTDPNCEFGMSTWFAINEGGTAMKADIYAFVNETCYNPSSPPLPVDLLTFTSQQEGCEIQLNWKSQNEENFGYYSLEASHDGLSFNEIVQIPGQNLTNLKAFPYSYLHKSPKSYYRLKMMDLDGSFTYSSILNVQLPCTSSKKELLLFPNPLSETDNILNVRFYAEHEDIQFTVLDIVGKPVMNLNLATGLGWNTLRINIGMLSSGTYFISMGQKATGKFVIAN